MFVDHLVRPRIRAQVFCNPREGRIAHMIGGAPYPRFERGAGKPERFGGAEDWPHVRVFAFSSAAETLLTMI
jgi:hypothetical protein